MTNLLYPENVTVTELQHILQKLADVLKGAGIHPTSLEGKSLRDMLESLSLSLLYAYCCYVLLG